MTYTTTDIELEAELQEIYMQATHWLKDISFLETETHFFRTIIDRYPALAGKDNRKNEFKAKINTQFERLEHLKTKIPVFLLFVKPFMGNLKKPINLDFLKQYNSLHLALLNLFESYRQTKNELFQYTESLIPSLKNQQSLNPHSINSEL